MDNSSPIVVCDFMRSSVEVRLDVREISSIDLNNDFQFIINMKNGTDFITEFEEITEEEIDDYIAKNKTIIAIYSKIEKMSEKFEPGKNVSTSDPEFKEYCGLHDKVAKTTKEVRKKYIDSRLEERKKFYTSICILWEHWSMK